MSDMAKRFARDTAQHCTSNEAVDRADLWSGQIPRSDLRASLAAAAPLILAGDIHALADEIESGGKFGPVSTPAAVTPEPAGAREPGQPRVFPPDSEQPMDVTLLDAPNGVRFRADPADQTAARWRALPEFGGDGGYRSWWLLNSTHPVGRALTLTEVPAVAEPEAGA